MALSKRRTCLGISRSSGAINSRMHFAALELANLWSGAFVKAGARPYGHAGQSRSQIFAPVLIGALTPRVFKLGDGVTFALALTFAYLQEFAPQREILASHVDLPRGLMDRGRRADRKRRHAGESQRATRAPAIDDDFRQFRRGSFRRGAKLRRQGRALEQTARKGDPPTYWMRPAPASDRSLLRAVAILVDGRICGELRPSVRRCSHLDRGLYSRTHAWQTT